MSCPDIGLYAFNWQSGEPLIQLVKQAQASNSVLVFGFHGVGDGHSPNVAQAEHNKLVRYLKQNAADIWAVPFIQIAQYTKEYSLKQKANR